MEKQKTLAEMLTDPNRKEFAEGQTAFMLEWGYGIIEGGDEYNDTDIFGFIYEGKFITILDHTGRLQRTHKLPTIWHPEEAEAMGFKRPIPHLAVVMCWNDTSPLTPALRFWDANRIGTYLGLDTVSDKPFNHIVEVPDDQVPAEFLKLRKQLEN